MPVKCTFVLNKKDTTLLACDGTTPVTAFSGQRQGRDNPDATDKENIGPLPRGQYFLIDRQSGGFLGGLRDWWSAHGYGTTDRATWFMLWNPATGDQTNINGMIRGNFRLHPMGPRGLSEGCITVVNAYEFDRLQKFIRTQTPSLPVPGSSLKAYGTLEVK
ncbi:DUF2778 domain-containing protein [Paraburkholderia acidisoli]|uniref:DUF2778 domain-containing protein n=1 Tax=Paraburkholderia acidisoli TaxID=2571748 RepID=A0A7Z2JJ48_9BURK|nr:DUF2778 domain-containing protein [Paraburkholderia acidisoli]QGZ65000.1 DUF2778 domain-containing protein [Paraburkholderia acidisoli]